MRDTASPISFPVNVQRLPAKGLSVTIEADEEQRAALARDHALLEVRELHATLLVESWKRDGIRVTGRVQADFVQACIVSLDPIDARIDEEVTGLFVPEGSRLARPDAIEGGEMLLDAEGEDGPETFAGDTIDVGLLAEEFFALAIDPYPKKPDAVPAAPAGDGDEERGPLYEKLKALKDRG